MLLLVTAPSGHLDRIFLFSFERTQYKNHFYPILVTIHYGVMEILSFSFSVLFSVMPNGGHLGMPNS